MLKRVYKSVLSAAVFPMGIQIDEWYREDVADYGLLYNLTYFQPSSLFSKGRGP